MSENSEPPKTRLRGRPAKKAAEPRIKENFDMEKQDSKRKVAAQQPVSRVRTRSSTKEKSEKEFVVEKILAKKIDGSTVKYLLKWRDYPESYSTWESKNSLNCPDLIKEFESNLRKERANERKKERTSNINEKNNVDIPVKKNLINSKISNPAQHSQKINQSFEDFITQNKKKTSKDSAVKRTVKNITYTVKNVELNEQIITIRQKDSKVKHVNKKVESNEHKKVKEKPEDSAVKHAVKNITYTVKNVELNEQILTKRQKDSGVKHVNKKVESNEHEVKKKPEDFKEKPTTVRNRELNEYEIQKKKHHIDSKGKSSRIKNAQLMEDQVTRKRKSPRNFNDSKEKFSRIKNAELKEDQITKKRNFNDSAVEHTIKNIPANERKVPRKSHEGVHQKRPVAVHCSCRNRKVPKIQNLQYYVKSADFPKKRKNGMLSVMRVSFQGSDVLRGLERFVDAGIAPGPLPDFLYDKPIKTGATEFQFTV